MTIYTWGYLKDAIYAKLDITEQDAQTQDMTRRFPIYANEAMTMICSQKLPKYDHAEFVIDDTNIGKVLTMPQDFISHGQDLNYFTPEGGKTRQFFDPKYIGNNKIMFFEKGTYLISYHARWVWFDNEMKDGLAFDIPNDVLECIPTYVASQCMKNDDLSQSAVFRQEFELLVSRIDDSNNWGDIGFKNVGEW